MEIKYQIYSTLLDAFEDYLRSSEIYQSYWGNSEDPSKTEDEFTAEQYQGLIDRINRVPFDSEPADRGTAFNEVVDCIIENRVSEKMDIASNKEDNTITANYNGRTFIFPLTETARYAREKFAGALTQQYTEATIETRYGVAKLYGYIDELLPLSVHDIKTTSSYKVGKFRHHWQKVVYPYCLNANGNEVFDFVYDVVVWSYDKASFTTFEEYYRYSPQRDDPLLTAHVEALIEFLEAHRDVITDDKIFNYGTLPCT